MKLKDFEHKKRLLEHIQLREGGQPRESGLLWLLKSLNLPEKPLPHDY